MLRVIKKFCRKFSTKNPTTAVQCKRMVKEFRIIGSLLDKNKIQKLKIFLGCSIVIVKYKCKQPKQHVTACQKAPCISLSSFTRP